MGSPVSLYSGYSFYQLDSTSPSPTRGEFHDRLQARSPSVQAAQSSPAQLPIPGVSPTLDSDTPTPQYYLQQGIQHHEANRLKESAICFEKSARENGGCGIGMLMWGLALRHGWGCEKNEKFAFKWLTRAAESAVEDLENARAGGGIDSNAVQVCATCLCSIACECHVLPRQNLSLLSMKLDNASFRDGV
jgi:TPR repeat protein